MAICDPCLIQMVDLQAQRRSVPKELIEQQKILSDKMHKLQVFLKEGGKQARQGIMLIQCFLTYLMFLLVSDEIVQI